MPGKGRGGFGENLQNTVTLQNRCDIADFVRRICGITATGQRRAGGRAWPGLRDVVGCGTQQLFSAFEQGGKTGTRVDAHSG